MNNIENAVLLSIKREWWEKILSGEKTLEVRKTYPTKLKSSYLVYVHISGEQGIQGYFICDRIYGGEYAEIEIDFDISYNGVVETTFFDEKSDYTIIRNIGNTALSQQELKEYGFVYEDEFGKNYKLFFWHTKNAVEYLRTIPLSAVGIRKVPQSWCYCKRLDIEL